MNRKFKTRFYKYWYKSLSQFFENLTVTELCNLKVIFFINVLILFHYILSQAIFSDLSYLLLTNGKGLFTIKLIVIPKYKYNFYDKCITYYFIKIFLYHVFHVNFGLENNNNQQRFFSYIGCNIHLGQFFRNVLVCVP